MRTTGSASRYAIGFTVVAIALFVSTQKIPDRPASAPLQGAAAGPAGTALDTVSDSEIDEFIAAIHAPAAEPSIGAARKRGNAFDTLPKGAAIQGYYDQLLGERNVWTSATGLSADGHYLVRQIERIGEEGLDPDRYDIELVQSLLQTQWTPDGRQQIERLLSASFQQLVVDLGRGISWHDKLQSHWFQPPPEIDPDRLLQDLVNGRTEIATLLDGIRQISPEYERLKSALAHYSLLVAKGGWPRIPEGPTLRPGERNDRVALLRQRLLVSGDYLAPVPDDTGADIPVAESTSDGIPESVAAIAPVSVIGSDIDIPGEASRPVDAPDYFSPSLADAVRQFQIRHGLEADGLVGRKTLAALNMSAEQRLQQIRANLERMRWMPRSLGRRYVITNIPAFRLGVFDGGQQVLTMPVVVGKQKHQTPVFSDEIEYVVFNPTWTVPRSIAQRELFPKERAQPGYLERANFELVRDVNGRTQVYAPHEVPGFADVGKPYVYALRQKPGSRNALGRVKFMLPNQWSIYLHDTTARSLFSRSMRAYSHGCVRLGQPEDLARTLLGFEDWQGHEVDDIFDSSRTRTVRLKTPIANHLVYLTSFVDEHGIVQFRPDIYELDQPLIDSLSDQPGPEWFDTVVAELVE